MRTEEERVTVVLAESGRAIGGTERVVWELATRLPRRRFDVRVWLSPDPGVDEFAAALESREIPVERVAEVDSRWDWRGMFDSWRRLRRARPALLHVHHVWPAADRYLSAIAESAGVPHLVVTEHIVGESHSPAQRTLKRRELARADAVTAVCGAVADALATDLGVARARLRVVPNGTDVPDEEAERPAARRLRETLGAGLLRPLWVCVGRLEPQKGHAVLLDGLAELQRRGVPFVGAIAGAGSLRASLEARAAELGIAERVRFLGTVDPVGPLLAAADAVVMPSLWEGLPLTLLEAMARGRPVVATAVGGIPEVLVDGVHGRLVPPGDAMAIADALERIHRKPDPARDLGRNAARLVREDYTWERVAEGIEALYDDVLGLASFTPGSGRDRRDRSVPSRGRAARRAPDGTRASDAAAAGRGAEGASRADDAEVTP